MRHLDECMTVVLTDLSALKRDENVGLRLVFVLKNRTLVQRQELQSFLILSSG